MPTRRQIREAAIQFLYCSDLEGGAEPSDLREPFWEFVTETDRRNLQVATFRTVHHLAHGREERLAEFVDRAQPALAHLAALPPAEALKEALTRLLALESSWSIAFGKLGKLPKAGADSAEALHLPLSAPVAEMRRYACIGEQVVYFARLEIPTRYVQMKFDLLGNQ
jgi:hypothetical protein